jgi:hypothetical protein
VQYGLSELEHQNKEESQMPHKPEMPFEFIACSSSGNQ